MNFAPYMKHAADALRNAEDGLTESELGAILCLRFPGPVIREMNRSGYIVAEDRGHLFMVREPVARPNNGDTSPVELTGPSDQRSPATGLASSMAPSDQSSSPSGDGRLFQPPPVEAAGNG